MNWFQKRLDTWLQLPMSYELRSIRKDPKRKRQFCNRDGKVTNMKMKYGGDVYCCCVILESDAKDRINKWRKRFGLRAII